MLRRRSRTQPTTPVVDADGRAECLMCGQTVRLRVDGRCALGHRVVRPGLVAPDADAAGTHAAPATTVTPRRRSGLDAAATFAEFASLDAIEVDDVPADAPELPSVELRIPETHPADAPADVVVESPLLVTPTHADDDTSVALLQAASFVG